MSHPNLNHTNSMVKWRHTYLSQFLLVTTKISQNFASATTDYQSSVETLVNLNVWDFDLS